MAGSVNKAIIIGNVGKDPEIRRTADGRPVASFSIATSETWRDKNTGEKREKTEWHRIVCFSEPLCKVIESYVKKGSKIYVEGQLTTRKYEKSGTDHYVTEIVLQGFNATLTLLEAKGSGGPPPNDGNESADRTGRSAGGAGGSSGGSSDRPRTTMDKPLDEKPYNKVLDDEIPF